MKKLIFALLIACPMILKAQVTPIAEEYKTIYMGGNGNGDYTKNLLLLHQIYNGTLIDMNYAVGTITAFRGARGAANRINVAEVNSSSAYSLTIGMLKSFDGSGYWKLKTCIYQGAKYLAVDVPYLPPHHNWGYRFTGSTVSTGENMKSVAYEVAGQPVNQNVLSDIQDYTPNMSEAHFVSSLTIMGDVGIGTLSPQEKLSVNGKIRAHEVKVETANWPDYVFAPDYKMFSLPELAKYIKANGHLPNMPSATEAESKGIDLGEMNRKLLEKVEELTLHLIEKDKELNKLNAQISRLPEIEKKLNELLNQSQNSKANKQ